MTTKKKLLSIKGLSESKVDKIKVCIVSVYIDCNVYTFYCSNRKLLQNLP